MSAAGVTVKELPIARHRSAFSEFPKPLSISFSERSSPKLMMESYTILNRKISKKIFKLLNNFIFNEKYLINKNNNFILNRKIN